MVGYFVIQIELQKPEIIQPLPHNPHQLPLAADVVQKQQQHQLQDHDRVFRFMPFASVKARDSLSYESKVDRTLHGSERIVQSDPLFQIHAIVKQFRLALLDRPNHGPTFTPLEGHRRSSWATGPAEEGWTRHYEKAAKPPCWSGRGGAGQDFLASTTPSAH